MSTAKTTTSSGWRFSLASASTAFVLWGSHELSSPVLPILAATLIQCRLLCNLFDGMVAVEGGKATISGELFNDVPDRIADSLILVAGGYATSVVPWAHVLGWAAALGALMTAYVRNLGTAIGAPVDFRGPMAKQHRMAAMTLGCLLTACEPWIWPVGWTLFLTLLVITIGCVITAARRVLATYLALEATSDDDSTSPC